MDLLDETCFFLNIKGNEREENVAYLPNMVLGCAMKMEGSTTKRVLSTIRVTLSEVRRFRLPTAALAPGSFGFS